MRYARSRSHSRSGQWRRGRGWCWAVLLAAALSGPGAVGARALPRCPPAHSDRCQSSYNVLDEYNFILNGTRLQYKFIDSGYFTLSCPSGITLDDPALPRFDEELRVNHVEFECPLPAVAYAAVLRALNVAVSDKLTLTRGPLRGDRLAGLEQLRTLVLASVDLEPSARDLRHLTGLRRLRLDGTNFTASDLERLPAGLELLHLVRTGIGSVPAAALGRFADLAVLLVTEDYEPLLVEAAGGLRALTMKSDGGADAGLTLPGGLENLTIAGWAPRWPRPWKACAGLGALELVDAAAEALPAGWVARCAALHSLRVRGASLARLEAGALRGAAALARLSLAGCALRALPAGLLDDATALRELDLSDNRLLALPGGLFERSRQLGALALSGNLLGGAVLDSLAAVTSLATLRLRNNPALDACPADIHTDYVLQRGWSSLRNLKSLSELDLSFTNTSHVCEDWRQLPRLRRLALAHSAVARLQRSDLRFNTADDVTVDLTGANVTDLDFEREDAEAAGDEGGAAVRVALSEPALRCDCELYWAAAALRRPRARLRVDGARCADGRALRDVPLDELVCAAPGPCPAGCACGVRADAAARRVLRVACAGAGLRRVPRARDALHTLYALPGDAALDLRLANNAIDILSPEDASADVKTLDLRNNTLTLIDATTATALVSRADRRVWLAGNPLDCSCRAAAALAAVRSSPTVFADRAVAACVGGATLAAAALDPPLPCSVSRAAVFGDAGGTAAAAVALAAVAAAAAALAVALLRPELRLRAKAALRARGLLPRAREFDDGRVYDAFVSFAHADEAVVRELVEQLEGGAAPLRLCVHYRDWMPGGWIPTQIAASVRVSRRTVAVVSAAFLRSRWARAEFREAYAAALRDAEPRLVVVLLEDPARLPLDAELRAYLAANTYVRWGDPWFWPKLRRALPAPRRPPPYTKGCSTAMMLNNVSVQSAATASTDGVSAAQSAATASTDVSAQAAATASTDVSAQSAATASTDVSAQSAATASTDVTAQYAATASTEVSAQSPASALTDVSTRSTETVLSVHSTATVPTPLCA